jgi:hypothetical protein
MRTVFLVAAAAVTLATSLAAEPLPMPDGQSARLVLGADGVQLYACEPRNGGHAWVFKGPEAALFDAAGRQVGTHGAGPFWRMAQDGSMVTGEVAASVPSPNSGAIPWLLLRARTHEGDGALAGVLWIRRVDTSGGVAPAQGCDASQAGSVARMRYSATYEFLGD